LGPGCGDGEDFLVGGLTWACGRKSGGDDHSVEGVGHVLERHLGLGGVPGRGQAVGFDISGGVAVPGVPEDDGGGQVGGDQREVVVLAGAA